MSKTVLPSAFLVTDHTRTRARARAHTHTHMHLRLCIINDLWPHSASWVCNFVCLGQTFIILHKRVLFLGARTVVVFPCRWPASRPVTHTHSDSFRAASFLQYDLSAKFCRVDLTRASRTHNASHSEMFTQKERYEWVVIQTVSAVELCSTSAGWMGNIYRIKFHPVGAMRCVSLFG